jgi:hypothetical protein
MSDQMRAMEFYRLCQDYFTDHMIPVAYVKVTMDEKHRLMAFPVYHGPDEKKK